jgi:hypothetical protein
MRETLSYRRARDLLLLAGLIVLGLVAITMILRGVDPIEVTATLFFAPVFVAFLFFGWPAGLLTGVAAAVGYVAMRWSAIELVGFPALSGLVFSRVVGFLAFGGIGGWAAGRLRQTLDKMALYDAVDDATGLGNARAAIDAVVRERGRADRYQSVVSVVTARFPLRDSKRRTALGLAKLGVELSGGVRTSDHVAHVTTGDRHLVVVVLPETGGEGAAVVAENLDGRIAGALDTSVETTVMVYPDDPDAIDSLVGELREIDSRERPQGRASTTTSPS